MAFQFGDKTDRVDLQQNNLTSVGAGAGDDVYVIDAANFPVGNKTITINDKFADGNNKLLLVGGLEIVSSQVFADAIELTLNNGIVVRVLGASTFVFQTGGKAFDTAENTTGKIETFQDFVTASLKTTVPAEGEPATTGGSVTVQETGGTEPVDPTNPTDPTEPTEPTEPVGETFTLTTGTDVIPAEGQDNSGDDTITGVNSSLLSVGTLQGADKIDGGDGADKFTVDMQQSWAGFTTGSMKNVETVNLTNTAGTQLSYSANGSTNVNKYVVDATKGSITLSDLTELAAVEVTGPANTGVITVTYGAATTVATGSQTDTQTLKVTNVGTANTKTDGTNDAKVGTVTIAKVEALALETAGTANTLNLTAVSDAKSITVKGEGTTEIQTVGAAVTSFDASASTGKVIANLTNAASNALTSVKTGAGDDTITVVADDLTASAVIAGGAGADKLVIGAGAGRILQATMTGVETLNIGTVSSALTFSGANVTDLATVNVEGLTTAAASLVNMKAAALTVNSIGANTQAFGADNAAAITYNLNASTAAKTAGTATEVNASDATFGGATSLTVNVGEFVTTTGGDIVATAAKDVTLNVTGKAPAATELTVFNSVLTAGEATSVKVNSTGQLGATANIAAAKATSGTIVAGSSVSANDTLDLDAAKMASLDVTAKQNIDFTGSTLTGLQTLTVDTTKAYTQGVALDDAYSVTVKGAASTSAATFTTLGKIDGSLTHAVNLTATGLKAGLNTGNINAGTSTSTIDISGVTGNVQLGNVSANGGIDIKAANLGGTLNATAKALATTTGNISVDVSSAQGQAKFTTINAGTGDVTLLATNTVGGLVTGKITGNNVTVNAGQALGTVTLNDGAGTNADDITAKTSVTYTGANIANNGVDITTATDSTAFTATLNGGAKDETITINGGSAKQTSITVSGNLGAAAAANKVTVVLADNTGSAAANAQAVNLSGLTSTATAGDATFETVTDISKEVDSAITYTGSVKDDQVKYTAASGGAVITNANAVALSDSTTTDKDNLTIDANAETVVFSNLSLTGIEQLTVLATSTATTAEKITPVADKDTVVINASAISGKAVALLGQTAAFSGDLVLTGTAGVDVIDLSKLTAQDDGTLAVELFVVGGAGNDTIVGSTAASKQKDNIIFAATAAGNGTDSITGFEQGASKDILDFTGFLTATKAAMNAVITANPGGTTALENDVSLVVDIAGGQDITTAAGLKTAIEAGGEYANLDMANSESGIVITAANSDAGTAQNVFYVSTDASGVFTVTLVGTVTGSAVDIDLWHADNFA